jgi:hypothetical protein
MTTTKLVNVVESDAIRPFQVNVPEADRLAPAHRRDPVTREGNRRRLYAGRAARDRAEARALLGDGLRLAQGRSAPQRRAELHHQDRWSRHPLHSRAFEARECLARHHHSRLAGLHRRAAQAHRAADESDGPWWNRGRRFRRRDSEHAGLRLLGQAHRPNAEQLLGCQHWAPARRKRPPRPIGVRWSSTRWEPGGTGANRACLGRTNMPGIFPNDIS